MNALDNLATALQGSGARMGGLPPLRSPDDRDHFDIRATATFAPGDFAVGKVIARGQTAMPRDGFKPVLAVASAVVAVTFGDGETVRRELTASDDLRSLALLTACSLGGDRSIPFADGGLTLGFFAARTMSSGVSWPTIRGSIAMDFELLPTMLDGVVATLRGTRQDVQVVSVEIIMRMSGYALKGAS